MIRFLTEDAMRTVKLILLSVAASFVLVKFTFAQNFEITPQVGGQINGGLDITPTIFHRIKPQNAFNYGLTAGYLVGGHYGFEFQWNKMNSGTNAQPIGGVKCFK